MAIQRHMLRECYARRITAIQHCFSRLIAVERLWINSSGLSLTVYISDAGDVYRWQVAIGDIMDTAKKSNGWRHVVAEGMLLRLMRSHHAGDIVRVMPSLRGGVTMCLSATAVAMRVVGARHEWYTRRSVRHDVVTKSMAATPAIRGVTLRMINYAHAVTYCH